MFSLFLNVTFVRCSSAELLQEAVPVRRAIQGSTTFPTATMNRALHWYLIRFPGNQGVDEPGSFPRFIHVTRGYSVRFVVMARCLCSGTAALQCLYVVNLYSTRTKVSSCRMVFDAVQVYRSPQTRFQYFR